MGSKLTKNKMKFKKQTLDKCSIFRVGFLKIVKQVSHFYIYFGLIRKNSMNLGTRYGRNNIKFVKAVKPTGLISSTAIFSKETVHLTLVQFHSCSKKIQGA